MVSINQKLKISLSKKRGTSYKWMVVNTLAALIILFYLYDKGVISIAFINGEPVTIHEAVRIFTSNDAQSEIDRLVARKLIEYEAKRQKIVVTKDEISRQIYIYKKEAIRQGITVEELLDNANYNVGDIDEDVKLQITIYKVVSIKSLEPTDKEIDEYFEENSLVYSDEEKEIYKEQIKLFLYKDKISQGYDTWIKEAQASSEVKYILNY